MYSVFQKPTFPYWCDKRIFNVTADIADVVIVVLSAVFGIHIAIFIPCPNTNILTQRLLHKGFYNPNLSQVKFM